MAPNVVDPLEVKVETTVPLSSIKELQRLPEQPITHAQPVLQHLTSLQMHLPISEVRVAMAEIKIENKPVKFVTNVGSCVAICMYDPLHKCGGLAHIMLPNVIKSQDYIPGKFADTAVPTLAEALRQISGKDTFLYAKIAGGACILPNLNNNDQHVGKKNVDAVKAALKDHRIKLVAEDVGGSLGRRVEFDIGNGTVTVRLSNGEIREL
ncbi:MAG: chemotaxis protein CheD [Candidatus Bathyarchaeota archaeon]|nr:chemotaxis protein CheD [Candidatus Bathyarchaeota archaeon]